MSDSENPNIADPAERERFRMRPAPSVRDAAPENEPPELLQPEYPPDILPMLVLKATGDAHAPGDPANYPDPPPPPSDTASGAAPIAPPEAGPPGNVDVPYVNQDGDTLACTMGNWTNEPSAYAYQWRLDGSDTGSDSDTLVVTAGDVGRTATCVVTATNDLGSTAAPPSNGVVIASFT